MFNVYGNIFLNCVFYMKDKKESEKMFTDDVIYFFCISFDFIPEISIVDVTSVIDFALNFIEFRKK